MKLLAREQQPDGSLGAFHSRRSNAQQRTPTTEAGIERALALGAEILGVAGGALCGLQTIAAPVFDWLWEQQSTDGAWDLGPRAPGSIFLPLSADWRKPEQRRQDWTTRILTLLALNPPQSTLPHSVVN